MAAAASSSSSSSRSYASSSYSQLPAYARNLAAPVDSNWTPNSAVSDLTDDFSSPPDQLRPLDLGPPGFQATIILFEGTSEEKTIYLGHWEIVGNEHRRVIWHGSYDLERLEHFLPTAPPAEIYPLTLHSRHRPFSEPSELEQHITFSSRHRVRYTNEDGLVIYDQPTEVKYEFTTIEYAFKFQGDLRRKDLVDFFDVDVVWTDSQGRTDTFGNVRGIGTVQRLKLWSDQYNTSHSLTVLANRAEQRFREFQVDQFEGEIRHRDDRRRTLRLSVRGRRGSAPESGRRISLAAAFRSRRGSSSSSLSQSSLDMRYLGIQFTRPEDYRRFLDAWVVAHSADSEYHGIAYPADVFELPSPQIAASSSYEITSQSLWQTDLPILPAPAEEEEDDGPTP